MLSRLPSWPVFMLLWSCTFLPSLSSFLCVLRRPTDCACYSGRYRRGVSGEQMGNKWERLHSNEVMDGNPGCFVVSYWPESPQTDRWIKRHKHPAGFLCSISGHGRVLLLPVNTSAARNFHGTLFRLELLLLQLMLWFFSSYLWDPLCALLVVFPWSVMRMADGQNKIVSMWLHYSWLFVCNTDTYSVPFSYSSVPVFPGNGAVKVQELHWKWTPKCHRQSFCSVITCWGGYWFIQIPFAMLSLVEGGIFYILLTTCSMVL